MIKTMKIVIIILKLTFLFSFYLDDKWVVRVYMRNAFKTSIPENIKITKI